MTPHTLANRVLTLLGWNHRQAPSSADPERRGRKPKITDWQIQVAMVIHMIQTHGTLGCCVFEHLGIRLSETALSLRRRAMSVKPFLTIMAAGLRPLAQLETHAGCFFAGLRLVGHDGTTLSVANTPAVLASMAKAKTRKGLAAFAKVGLGTLVELGTHNPLAAAIGLQGESESVLFSRVLDSLPERCLLILDRWYGNAPVLHAVQQRCAATQGGYLIRVKSKLAAPLKQSHADGSATVEVSLRDAKGKSCQTLEVREVRARLQRRQDGKWVEVRLWTSLSVEQASAEQVVALYARRWEQEVFYKELKMRLGRSDLLLSQTPETAAQETAALLLAASLVAEERLACAEQSGEKELMEAGAMRISFGWCVQLTTALWLFLAGNEDLLNEVTQAELVRRTREKIARHALPKRRQRSCDRRIRQPVCKWPRMTQPFSVTSDFPTRILPIT